MDNLGTPGPGSLAEPNQGADCLDGLLGDSDLFAARLRHGLEPAYGDFTCVLLPERGDHPDPSRMNHVGAAGLTVVD
jgi:hypothetical protein